LIWIRHVDAVITGVADSITVGVALLRIGHARTIVAAIRDVVIIRIGLASRVAYIRAHTRLTLIGSAELTVITVPVGKALDAVEPAGYLGAIPVFGAR
jgi:hypothetical protein